jgi:cysteine desulfurase
MFVYLDNGAGRPVDSRVLEEMVPFFSANYGNPASFHSEGFKALEAINHARKQVADLINSKSEEIIFTSGATEANNLAIIGAAIRNKKKGNQVVLSAIEHISVINIFKELTRQGFEVITCPVDDAGLIDVDKLDEQVTENTALVSIMTANGEIGTIQPIQEAVEIVKERDALFHTDATAAIGNIPLDVEKLGVDLMTLSSNDIYGPKGMGGLYIKKGVRVKPHMIGGGQENGIRSGSENVPGIVGMGKAAELIKKEMHEISPRLSKQRDHLVTEVLKSIPESYLNGHPTQRLPTNANIRFSYIEGEALLMSLDSLGIKLSSGSACAAKTLEPSHVLLSCGLKHEEAHGSLVFNLGKDNNMEHIEYVIEQLPGVVKRLRSMSPLTPKELM